MISEKFSFRLKQLRKSYNLTLEQLGQSVDMKKNSLSNIENEKEHISFDAALRIANFLCVSLDYLTGRNDDPQYKIYLQKAEEALLANMSEPFIKLFNYAKLKGLKKEPITHKEHWSLIQWFEEWKKDLIEYNDYQDKKRARSEKYHENDHKRFKKAHEEDSIINSIIMKTNDFGFVLNEIRYEKPDYYANMSLEDRQKNRYLIDALQRILNLKDPIEDPLTNSAWYYVPFPNPLSEYLWPIVQEDKLNPTIEDNEQPKSFGHLMDPATIAAGIRLSRSSDDPPKK